MRSGWAPRLQVVLVWHLVGRDVCGLLFRRFADSAPTFAGEFERCYGREPDGWVITLFPRSNVKGGAADLSGVEPETSELTAPRSAN